MLQSEDELDQDLIARYTYPTLDGITDVDKFYKSKYQILWILKEANWNPEQICRLREFHKDITKKSVDEKWNWKSTYQLIVQVSYAILNDIYKYDDEDIHPSDKVAINAMNSVALVNVKKIAGGSRVKKNGNEIWEHYINHGEFLHEQIRKISPNIIINCSGIYGLFSELSGGSKCSSIKIHEKGWQFNYSFNDDRLVINAYHPGQFKITQHKYFDAIAEIRKLWALS